MLTQSRRGAENGKVTGNERFQRFVSKPPLCVSAPLRETWGFRLMDDRPPTPLEYSSLAEEQKRHEERARERREALDNYNESTFGERHPYRNAFIRAAIWIAGFALCRSRRGARSAVRWVAWWASCSSPPSRQSASSCSESAEGELPLLASPMERTDGAVMWGCCNVMNATIDSKPLSSTWNTRKLIRRRDAEDAEEFA